MASRPSPNRRDLLAAGLALTVVPNLCAAAAGGAAPRTLADLARPTKALGGAPRAGDVILRCLTPKTLDTDPHSTMRALDTFHATRLEWVYSADRAFINRVTGSGRVFGGTVAAGTWDGSLKDPTVFDAMVVRGLDGKPVMAPWKRKWGRTFWGCVNNPEFERGYTHAMAQVLETGVDVLQRDEPEANAGALRWGGCYCDHCLAAFRGYLAAHTTPEDRKSLGTDDLQKFDYRAYTRAHPATKKSRHSKLHRLFAAFQSDATLAFHERTRRALSAAARRTVPMSCNNGGGTWKPYHRCFDWGFGELPARYTNAAALVTGMRDARAAGRLQVYTMPLPDPARAHDAAGMVRLTRRAIATAYAAGGWMMVPWDVFLPQNQPRYFGRAADFADLYGFVRAAAAQLEGHEEAFAVGAGVTPLSSLNPAPIQIDGPHGVLAIARVKPADTHAPAVVHLVDWSESPARFSLSLDPQGFGSGGGGAGLRVTLLTPAPYEPVAHQKAEANAQRLRPAGSRLSVAQSEAYQPLARRVVLPTAARDGRAVVAVPPLGPWGLLMIEPA